MDFELFNSKLLSTKSAGNPGQPTALEYHRPIWLMYHYRPIIGTDKTATISGIVSVATC